ncbi:energy-coupling factor transporter transmembrane protein EcfT [Savagea sp. SN6]|uniref:Energy-coupling factor transporter transmembrane protein EcfT n=1 Tax=Savagea serpentis TaxID=2785297 RepID=A0A8J7GLA7_9BACL|nr:energy-coupling factor transporter transmembrane protein EcfT [Savagea serpentis]MBF4500993.1 energy-coupling factor transporter transmembrane protein EcfT [Savagea serpentis]
MLEKMIIGRYVPGTSFVHRLDPRSKLLFIFFFIFTVFLANDLLSYSLLLAFTFFAVWLTQIPFRFLFNGLKIVFYLILFTFLMHVAFTKGGEVLFSIGRFHIYEEGLKQGFFISIRFFTLIFMTTLLTLTTSPISVTDGVERLLNPLNALKFPVHELALMMSIALRFIPTLMDETDKIVKAQVARGSDLNTGTLKERFQAVVPLLIPLFINSFKRATDLAVAMEVRGYRGGEGRTRYRQLAWQGRDTLVLLVLFAFSGVLLYLRMKG